MGAAMKPMPCIVATCVAALTGCAAQPAPTVATAAREDIHILRSIREAHAPESNWCDARKTGFAPMLADAERFFSFWSIDAERDSGRIIKGAVLPDLTSHPEPSLFGGGNYQAPPRALTATPALIQIQMALRSLAVRPVRMARRRSFATGSATGVAPLA